MPLSFLIKCEELIQLVITFVMNKQLHTEGSENAALLQALSDLSFISLHILLQNLTDYCSRLQAVSLTAPECRRIQGATSKVGK